MSPVNQSTPRALNRLIQDELLDINQWHSGRHLEYLLDKIDKLSSKDLTSLGLDDKYYDAILESHEQIMSSKPCCGERMDDHHFDDASATQAVLKHPAWDHLIDTSPKGWMEFYKSLCCNAMSFSITLVPFESFNMLYCKKGHGLCLCGLGICRYC
jgi:hypothetical protein